MKKILLRLPDSLSLLLRDYLNTTTDSMNRTLLELIHKGLSSLEFVTSEEYKIAVIRERKEKIEKLASSLTPKQKKEVVDGLKNNEAKKRGETRVTDRQEDSDEDDET